MKKIVIMTDRKNELAGLMKCLDMVFPGCEIQTLSEDQERTDARRFGENEKPYPLTPRK